MDDDKKLDILWDERLIMKTMVKFARTLDAKDQAAHASCFTDPVNINFKAFTGLDEVRVSAALWAQFGSVLLSDAPSHHMLGNFDIAVDGDRAGAMVYMISSLWTGTPDLGLVTNRQYGWYAVSFERQGDEWKISRLELGFEGVEGSGGELHNDDPQFAKMASEVFSSANMEAAKAYLGSVRAAEETHS